MVGHLKYLLLVAAVLTSCQKRAVNIFTLKSEREKFIAEKTHFIDSVFSLTHGAANEKAFMGAFWASELMLRKNSGNETVIRKALQNFTSHSYRFKQSLLQHIYTLYPSEFGVEADSLMNRETDEKLFAMMAEYLIQSESTSLTRIIQLLKQKFPGNDNNPFLQGFMLNHSGHTPANNQQWEDLVRFRTALNEATIYVLVHRNRDLPGYAMIQKSNGQFVSRKGDTLKIRLLARSITNLPGYLTNGNTPAGVFSLQDIGLSDNVFIGTTPMIITALPFEVSPVQFSFGRLKTKEWTKEDYDRFFPESWLGLTQKNMAFLAGQAGRSEIIMHGTAIDEEFYKDQTYYPFTPSLGCFCALERWDRTNGILTESEQQKLIDALKENRIEKALVYLVER